MKKFLKKNTIDIGKACEKEGNDITLIAYAMVQESEKAEELEKKVTQLKLLTYVLYNLSISIL